MCDQPRRSYDEGAVHGPCAARAVAVCLYLLPPTTDVCTAPLRELGGSSKTRSYVQGHRDVHYMDATFAFLSYLKLPAHGYAKIPFSV